MLETHIKILASFYTALLIAAVASLLVFGGFKFKSHSVKGKVISATMVDISQLKPNTKNRQPVKKPPVKKPPVKKPPVKKPPVKKPPVKKPPVKKPPVKKPSVKKIIEPKIDVAAQELERQKLLDREKRRKEIQKKKLLAQKRSEQAEQDLKDLANKIKNEENERPIENIGNKLGDIEANELNQLMARYQQSVIKKVNDQWRRPATANKDLLCYVRVRQIPGGGVIDATIASPCNANSIVKRSIIAAIKKADPLPYKGFEKVFDRSSVFIFRPEE
jgi:colicin import membrane protein